MGLERIQRSKPLPDDVYDALLDKLMWGRLAPDAPLSIDGLAQMLGVSPTPVREALARLEVTGLVRRLARRGYRVAPPMSHDQMGELVDARLVLETGTLERAMLHVDDLLPDLERAYGRHEASTATLLAADGSNRAERLREYFENDWDFHAAIGRHCGNRYLANAVESLFFRVHRMRQAIGAGHVDAPLALAEHSQILDAVRRNDTAKAVEMMQRHLHSLHGRVETDDA